MLLTPSWGRGNQGQKGTVGKGTTRLSAAGLLQQQGLPMSKGSREQPSEEKYGMWHRHFELQGSKRFSCLDFLLLSHPTNLAFCFSSPKNISPWQGLVPARNSIYPNDHVCLSRQCWRDCSKTGHLCEGSLPLAGSICDCKSLLSPPGTLIINQQKPQLPGRSPFLVLETSQVRFISQLS